MEPPDKDPVFNIWQSITEEELAKHMDVEKGDAWMCIRGIVYNVSEYAAHHPGGFARIQKYAGKDATETFNSVHAYVSPDLVLRGRQIGVLKGHPDAPKGFCFHLKKHTCSCCCIQRVKHPTSYFKQDSIVGTYIVEFDTKSSAWDWTVGVTEKNMLHVYKCVGSKAWLSVYGLPEPLVSDQINVNFRNKFKTMEVTLRKPIPTSIWAEQMHGLKNSGRFVLVTELDPGYSKFDAYIVTKKCLTPNVLLFGIQVVPSARIGVRLGFHVRLEKDGINRPYTPICPMLMDHPTIVHGTKAKEKQEMEDLPPTILYFMIKIYPNGQFTKMLDCIELDDGRELATLQVSTPHGYFDFEFIQDFASLFLISAGSGLAPMMRILQHFWHLNDKIRGKRIALWHSCQTEHDLIFKKDFQELEEATSWFHYFPVLTQVSEQSQWKGLRGRICEMLVNTCASEIGLDKSGLKKACICGPPGFNATAVESIIHKVKLENIFVFNN